MQFFNSLKQNTWLIILLFMAALLRFYQLDFQSLWDDEIASMLVADPKLSFKETLYLYSTYDNMPPLYFVVLRLLFTVFGYTSIVLRTFSALFGVAGVYAIYLLGRELFDKKTGLYAGVLLCLNYFSIYYSQEARPYSLLVFSVTLSFYYLIKFIKTPGTKTAIHYGLAALLMLYSQYIALTVLFSQGLILFYFLKKNKQSNKLSFLYCVLVSFGIIALGYIPAYIQLLKNYKITSSWIPAPGLDVYTNIFNGFFGNSELVLPIIYILVVLYFVFVTTAQTGFAENSETQNPYTLSFIITIPWLITVLLIFLIRSYLVMPIIVPRYFNLLLPAVILMAAIGLSSIKAVIVRQMMAVVLILFQLTDLVVIKKYYTQLTKPQYREAAAFINNKRQADEPVVAKVGWHYKLFFNYQKNEVPYFPMDLNSYLSELAKDTSKIKSFWYAAVREATPQLDDKNASFLNKNFFNSVKGNFFETNALYFEKKGQSGIVLDNRNFKPSLLINGNEIFMDGSSAISYPEFILPQGLYNIVVSSKSEPQPPINNVNASYKIIINNKVVGTQFCSNGNYFSSGTIAFAQPKDTLVKLEIHFSNDTLFNGADRNLFINSVYFQKK